MQERNFSSQAASISSPTSHASNTHSGMIHITWKRPFCRWKNKRQTLMHHQHTHRQRGSARLDCDPVFTFSCLPLHLSNRSCSCVSFHLQHSPVQSPVYQKRLLPTCPGASSIFKQNLTFSVIISLFWSILFSMPAIKLLYCLHE